MSGSSRTGNVDGYEMLRAAMVDRLRSHYGIRDERVLEVMSRLQRHRFVPPALVAQAYKDGALPIASRQTISQPLIVARMTELLELTGSEKVLEIGAGTGYQTAVLASLARKVFAIERLAPLAVEASERLKALGFRNIDLRAGDGTQGWPAYAPFDSILVAAGSPAVPEPLKNQLRIGGKLVVPVGETQQSQVLVRVLRTESGFEERDFGPCSFVPLIGEHGWKDN
jgi:protein-L-isoaspartate(D-aspartate) O-methyltransferase